MPEREYRGAKILPAIHLGEQVEQNCPYCNGIDCFPKINREHISYFNIQHVIGKEEY